MTIVRPLVLETDRHEVAVGESITLTVRDSWKRPLEDAIVKTGSETERTDSAGRCELTLDAPGFWRIVAVKSPDERIAYKPATMRLRAVPRPVSPRRAQRIVAGPT